MSRSRTRKNRFIPQHISMGALAPPLREQLRGLGLTPERVRHHQADADAISRLGIRGILPESQTQAARVRLCKAIVRDLKDAGCVDGTTYPEGVGTGKQL